MKDQYDDTNPRPPSGVDDPGNVLAPGSQSPFTPTTPSPWSQAPGLIDGQGRSLGDPNFDYSTARWTQPPNPGQNPGPYRNGYVFPSNTDGTAPAGIAPGTSAAAASTATSPTAKLLQALVGVGGAVAGHAAAGAAGSGAVPPELSQLLDMGIQRAQYQNPLFQAVTNGSYAMLPTFAKAGTTPPSGTL